MTTMVDLPFQLGERQESGGRFSHSSAPFSGTQLRSRTSGVFPIASRIDISRRGRLVGAGAGHAEAVDRRLLSSCPDGDGVRRR